MRKPRVALIGCLLLALGLAGPAARPARAAAAPAAPAVEFEDPAVPPAQREALARAAQQVSRWAMVQRVVQAVKAQEAAPVPMERVQAIDEAWQRGEDPEGLATALGRNDCAQALQTLMSANPGYGEAFVADDRGALVCMSQRTGDYWQGDEPTWSRAYADGAGAVFVSRNERDESTGLDMVHIAVPIKSGGRVVGVLIVGKISAPG